MTVPRSALPWATIALFAGSASTFIVAGSAPGYVRRHADGTLAFPDVEVFALDAFRHPDVFVLLATLLVGVPSAASVERVVGGVGVGAVYVVAGFASGFVEAARMAASTVPVVGAFGGTTALLTMWLVMRHRSGGGVVVASLVVAGWLGAAMLQAGPFPLLACGTAGWVGMYAMDATAPTDRRANNNPRARP